MKATWSFSARHRLLAAAAFAAALIGPMSAAAASRPGPGTIVGWAYLDPSGGVSSYHMDMREIVPLARQWRREKDEMLWFRSGGREYVIRDPEILTRVRATLAPGRKLDPETEDVAERMKALDRREERLDREQDRLESELERLEDERENILERRGERRGVASRDRDRERLSQLRNAADPIRARMRALSTQQEALAGEQAELSRREEALDRRQEAIEARTDAAMERLCRELLVTGRAQPYKR